MPSFASLWAAHPNVKGDAPLLDRVTYENQCAINVSAALLRTGVDMRGYNGAWSWQKDKPKYAIRAQELANWLATGASRLPTKVEKLKGEEVFGEVAGRAGIKGRNGIVFFQNYWGPGHQGDHIDLWNGSRLTDRMSWARIHIRFGGLGLGSDYRQAHAAWFWPLA